ncbi:rhamnan synthesis F family protein [Mycobacterium sp.]|uniref:rhamnan synthesis F family protein n=1 Tax=Mycobacterium sp. TaxID=1785 RepID=UPI003A87046B
MYHAFEIALAQWARLRSESERASHQAAERYRQNKDALGFICQTHQELPAQPPAGRRTLVLFAHFDPQGIVDPYVVYYLKALHKLGATIIFVSGSPSLTPESVAPIRELCAGVYTRETLSLDFGSWHLAWAIMADRGWSLEQFDRMVIANDSVYGPLFPLEEMWNSFHGADMYGAIESTVQKKHLQSFFLAWDLNERTRAFLNDFWNDFHYVVDKLLLIRALEVAVSSRALKAGLTLKAFLSDDAIRATYALSPTHQWIKRLRRRGGVNTSIYYWDGLVEHLRFPFIKTSLPRHNAPWQDSVPQLREFIEEHTDYPYDLIEANVERLGLGESTWVRPSGLRRWIETHSY